MTIVRNTVTHFIPNGFKREDPEGYYELVDQHRIWLDKHRNIPILNVETLNQFTQERNKEQKSLKTLLLEVPGIERCNYDVTNKQVNISVTSKNFNEVSKSVSTMLSSAGLPFQPVVKQHYNPTGSLGSKKTGTSKYLDTVSKYKKSRSPTSSIGTTFGNQSQISNRSTRTWNTNRIPTEIDFSEDNFPSIVQISESPITASERINFNPGNTYRDAVYGTNSSKQPQLGIKSPFKPVRSEMSPFTTDQTESSLMTLCFTSLQSLYTAASLTTAPGSVCVATVVACSNDIV